MFVFYFSNFSCIHDITVQSNPIFIVKTQLTE